MRGLEENTLEVLVADTGSTTTTYTDTSVTPGATYVYSVIVLKGGDVGNEFPRLTLQLAAPPAVPVIITKGDVTVEEGETMVVMLMVTDEDTETADLTWSISGGTDNGHFTVTDGGVLAFASAKDFEAPDDADTDGTYEVAVQVSDGENTTSSVISVTLSNLNEAPRVRSPTTFTVAEGATAVGMLTAVDAETPMADLVWSKSGGANHDHFLLSAQGIMTFQTAKDFEAPDDANVDGTYEVTVQVSDGDRTTTVDIVVTLSNLNEPPTADAGTDQEDVEQGATVDLSGAGTDPDAGDILTYTWTQTVGTTVTLSAPMAAETTLTLPINLAEGETLEFTLRVTDAAGL